MKELNVLATWHHKYDQMIPDSDQTSVTDWLADKRGGTNKYKHIYWNPLGAVDAPVPGTSPAKSGGRVHVFANTKITMNIAKSAKIGGLLCGFYALECSYIWIQSRVIQGDASLACFVAGFGFIIQAPALMIVAWLASRMSGKYRKIGITGMAILSIFSTIKVILWAQLSDDRFTLQIDPIYEVMPLDIRSYVPANILLLVACSSLGYFIVKEFSKTMQSFR